MPMLLISLGRVDQFCSGFQDFLGRSLPMEVGFFLRTKNSGLHNLGSTIISLQVYQNLFQNISINFNSDSSLYYQMFYFRTFFRLFSPNFKIFSPKPAFAIALPFLATIPALSLSHKSQQQSGQLLLVSDVAELYDRNLQGFQLVWYEMTGNSTLDSEVLASLRQFSEERKDLISTKFKIIIVRNEREIPNTEKIPTELVIIKKGQTKEIPLRCHLSYANPNNYKKLKYKHLHDKISLQLDKVLEVGAPNLRSFIDQLKVSDYSIVMVGGKDKQKSKTKFKSFIDSKSMFAKNVRKCLVGDQLAKNYLGLSKKEKGQIYVIVPKNNNVIEPAEEEISIDGNFYYIYKSNEVGKKLIFSPYIDKDSPDSLTMEISVDPNQDISDYMLCLQNQLEKIAKNREHPLHSIPKIINKQSKTAPPPLQISLYRNNFDQIIKVYSLNCKYSTQQKQHLLLNSHRWRYRGELDAEKLGVWTDNVVSGKEPQYYESEKEDVIVSSEGKPITFYSEQITGEEYYNIVNSDQRVPKVVFHFAQNCFSCKRFKHIYEQVAKQRQNQVQFYRIDNNNNKTKGMRNYHSTPIFMMYRDTHPFQYKNHYFTKKLFSDFVEITKQIKVMPYQTFQSHIRNHAQNQKVVQEILNL